MMNRLMMVAAVLAAALAATGCSDGRQAPPKTTVRVLHAAPGYDELGFLRVESLAAALPYRGGSRFTFDEDRYTFNVDAPRPDTGQPARLLSFSEQVLAGTEYTFVLLEAGGQVQSLVLEAPELTSATDAPRAMAVHAASALPAVDLFVEPVGTDLANAQPWGRIGFTESLAQRTLAAGQYEATFTVPGDKQNVLYSSLPFEVSAGQSLLFAVVDLTGEFLVPFGLVVMSDSANTIFGRSDESIVRAINAASDRAPRDVIVDGDSAAPIAAALPHGQVSDYVTIGRGEHQLTVTPAGNPGALELETTISAGAGRSHTILFFGEPGELSELFILDEKRPLTDRVKMRFYNGVNQFARLDFFTVLPDVPDTSVFPRASLVPPGASATQIFPPGTFELLVRDHETENVVAGPLPITLEEGGVYGVLAVDGDATSPVEIVLIDELE